MCNAKKTYLCVRIKVDIALCIHCSTVLGQRIKGVTEMTSLLSFLLLEASFIWIIIKKWQKTKKNSSIGSNSDVPRIRKNVSNETLRTDDKKYAEFKFR